MRTAGPPPFFRFEIKPTLLPLYHLNTRPAANAQVSPLYFSRRASQVKSGAYDGQEIDHTAPHFPTV